MPKKRNVSASKRMRSWSFVWWVILVVLYVLSIFLVGQIGISLSNPSNYPTNNLSDIVSFRSLVNQSSVFSSVEFTQAPVNTKQRIDVNVDMLDEVNIAWVEEIYLTENVTLAYEDFRFFSFEGISNLQAIFNGMNVDYYVTEYKGRKYYAISGFNITGKYKVNKLEYNFQIERAVNKSKLTKIPWLFNENYANLIHLPINNIPVHIGNTSDLSILSVKLNVPFRKIQIEHSGWVDLFVPPKDEWDKYQKEPGLYEFPRFEYPIEQECTEKGNLYSFKTRFSENNIASRISLVIIPIVGIPIALSLFLLSPFYIPLYILLHKRKFSITKSTSLKSLLLAFEIYSGPLIGLLVIALPFFGGELNMSLLSYIGEIVNPLGLILLLIYPLMYFFVLGKTGVLAFLSKDDGERKHG